MLGFLHCVRYIWNAIKDRQGFGNNSILSMMPVIHTVIRLNHANFL